MKKNLFFILLAITALILTHCSMNSDSLEDRPKSSQKIVNEQSENAENYYSENIRTENSHQTSRVFADPVTDPNQTKTISTVNFYRLSNSTTGDHFYTTNVSERNSAVLNGGYNYEGIIGSIHLSQVPNTVPLYRLYNPTTGDHFYTVVVSQKDAAIKTYGYMMEAAIGYVYTSHVTGTTPLYMLHNPTTGDHFYTVVASESDAAINNYGYFYGGIACFISTQKYFDPIYMEVIGKSKKITTPTFPKVRVTTTARGIYTPYRIKATMTLKYASYIGVVDETKTITRSKEAYNTNNVSKESEKSCNRLEGLHEVWYGGYYWKTTTCVGSYWLKC